MNWTALAAIGTFMAALVTAWMAVATSKVAKETRKSTEASLASLDQERKQVDQLEHQTKAMMIQAQVARDALQQSTLPILLVVPGSLYNSSGRNDVNRPLATLRDCSGRTLTLDLMRHGSTIVPGTPDDPFLWIVIEVRNIGTGLAIVSTPTLDFSRGSVGGTFFIGSVGDLGMPGADWFLPQMPAIPAGESCYFTARLDNSREFDQFDLCFVYQDLTRTRKFTMKVSCDLSPVDLLSLPQPSWKYVLPGMPIYEGYGDESS